MLKIKMMLMLMLMLKMMIDLTIRFSYDVTSSIEHSKVPLHVNQDNIMRSMMMMTIVMNEDMDVSAGKCNNNYNGPKYLSKSHQPDHLLQLFHIVREVSV